MPSLWINRNLRIVSPYNKPLQWSDILYRWVKMEEGWMAACKNFLKVAIFFKLKSFLICWFLLRTNLQSHAVTVLCNCIWRWRCRMFYDSLELHLHTTRLSTIGDILTYSICSSHILQNQKWLQNAEPLQKLERLVIYTIFPATVT